MEPITRIFNFISKAESDLDLVARKIIELCDNQSVVVFVGEIGAGKTTLIKQICKMLGVVDTVTSPTFSIASEYVDREKHKIFHLDLYRLKTKEEAFEIGIEDYLYGNSRCFIEWPELIRDILPSDYLEVKISTLSEDTREFEITKVENF